jgi:hypothetical protein
MAKSRAVMLDYNIPVHLWPFVVETVVRIQNLLPTRSNEGSKSPQQALSEGIGMPEQAAFPYIKHLRTYFCDAYYYVKSAHREQSDKLAPRALKCKLIGYADVHGRLFWIWNPALNKIVRVSAVKFNESVPDPPGYVEDLSVEYEVVFTDSTVVEMETVTITVPEAQAKAQAKAQEKAQER